MEYRFVLDAVGIVTRAFQQDGWWYLQVAGENAEQALAELDAYRKENPQPVRKEVSPPMADSFATTGVVLYVLILVSIAILESYDAYGMNWFAVGRMHAGDVRAGEWWRTITALTLHADLGHLMSNLVFGVIFGVMSGRTFGGGIAWLSIVLGGAIGNGVNAWIQSPDHTSIGASTAVFAALGLLVAHALHHWSDRTNRWKRWRPLIGGVVLLGFIGIGGERTDVGAHFTGFLSGLLLGWIGSLLHVSKLSGERIQLVSGILAIMSIVVAWILAAR